MSAQAVLRGTETLTATELRGLALDGVRDCTDCQSFHGASQTCEESNAEDVGDLLFSRYQEGGRRPW